MSSYSYDNGGRLPSHSPKGYGGSDNHPGRDYPEPPPQYTPPIPSPASPASSYHYPSPSNGPPAHPQSLAPYSNGQTITSPNAYGTRPYPHNLNHGHYAPAPQTFHGLPAPNSGPHNTYRDPDAHGTRSYEAYGDPYAPNRGHYQVNGGPHGGDTRSYEARREVYDPNRGSQAHRDPRASGTGQYPSPQAPEKQRYHGAGHGIPATENSAARTRGSHAQADASNAIPVSDFVSEHSFDVALQLT